MSRAEAATGTTVAIAEKVRAVMLEKLVREALARAPQGTSVGGDWLMAMAEAVWESAGAAEREAIAVEADRWEQEALAVKNGRDEILICAQEMAAFAQLIRARSGKEPT